MKSLIMILVVLLLQGCPIQEEDPCNEYYIDEWVSVTTEDGSVTTAEPSYKCRR